jgi:hypothetical protein
MLIRVCLRILASSRIPRYDLGRQTLHFLGGSVTGGEGILVGDRRGAGGGGGGAAVRVHSRGWPAGDGGGQRGRSSWRCYGEPQRAKAQRGTREENEQRRDEEPGGRAFP